MNKIKRNIFYALIFSIVVILLVFLISLIKYGYNSLKFDLNLKYLFFTFLLLISLLVIEALRMKVLLTSFKYNFPILYLIYVQLISLFFATITPLGSGGFVIKVYLLSKRKNFDIGGISGIITIIFVLNIIFSIILSIFSIFILRNYNFKNNLYERIIYYIVIFILLLGFLIFILIFKPEKMKLIANKIINLFKNLSQSKREKILDLIDKNYKRYKNVFSSFLNLKGKIVILLFLSSLYWLTLLSISPTLILSLNINEPFFKSFIIQFVYHFFVGWALTPGGSGISEAIFSSLFVNIVGLKNLPILTFLFRLFTYYIFIFLGGILSINEIKKIGDIKKIYEY